MDFDLGLLGADLRKSEEGATARFFVGKNGVGDVEGILVSEMGVPVEAAIHVEVETLERLGAGVDVVGVVEANGDGVAFAEFDLVADVDDDGQVATQVVGNFFAIEPKARFVHGGFEFEPDLFSGFVGWNIERLAIPTNALPLVIDHEGLNIGGVRKAHVLPVTVFESGIGTIGVVFRFFEFPITTEVDCFS